MHPWMTKCHIPFSGHCDLTSDLVLRIIVSGAYLLHSLRWGFQIWCVDASLDGGVSCTIFGLLRPDL